MDKKSFIDNVTVILKLKGYRKKGSYWYKDNDGILYCVNVQGSQWNKDNYYVNIGFALSNTDNKNPSILQWYGRHRCRGKDGELNISTEDLLVNMDDVFGKILSVSDIDIFLKEHTHTRIGTQYWF